ncbi:MAG: CaiB/BaiF CoA transferase family protein [Lautropia sp.]
MSPSSPTTSPASETAETGTGTAGLRASRDTGARSLPLPLAGIRILDLSAVISGPVATNMLLDQGAEVIKVESLQGDTLRRVGPAKGDLSAAFIAANRGKRSIALDLKQPAACDIVRRLAAKADVLVENFRPGAMQRLGLDPEALATVNPRLISVAITGVGSTGPYAAGRFYDAVVQGISGLAASQRDPSTGEPVLVWTYVCDKLTALTAAQAITAALFARARDGVGRRVTLSMLDATLAFQWPDAMYNHVFLDDPPQPFPPVGSTLRPYRAKDGMAAVMAPQNDEFAALVTGLGAPHLLEDPRFATTASRTRNMAALRAVLDPMVAEMSIDDMVERLRRAGVPIGRINEHDQMLADPQVRHNGTVVEIDHGDVGRVRLVRGAARFPNAAPMPRPAPSLGADGRDILSELGFTDADIDALRDAGVLGLPTT